MSRTPSPKRKTKMTDVNNSGDKTPVQASLPSVSPASAAVDKKDWAFKGVGSTTTEAKGSYVAAPQHEIPKEVDPLLVTMLCWPRDHNSPEEIAFSGWLKDYLVKELKVEVTMRQEGAMSVEIPITPAVGDQPMVRSTTLFSCHVDTVDNKMTLPETRKKLTYDPSFGTIALDSQSAGNCLGADDSAGIWLLLKMIEAGTPGTYLFHRGEERGGISAKAIAKSATGWLQGFQCAVAFDRKDTGDIVTVQGGSRCASPKFASRLAGMLDALGFSYQESLTGSYTDVKEYRKMIAECVNLSCGYDGAHSRNETLDYGHLAAMAKALPKVEWESLPIDRDPKAADPASTFRGKWSGMDGLFDDDEERQWGARAKNGTKKSKPPLLPVGKYEPVQDNGFHGMSMVEIETVIEDDVTWSVEAIVGLLRENAKLKGDNDMLTKLLGL